MRSHPQKRKNQVRLSVFNSEPLARLAEQRLNEAEIPCVIRSVEGGPGLRGSASNLPHALFVYDSYEMYTRDVLELEPMEIGERETADSAHQTKKSTCSLY